MDRRMKWARRLAVITAVGMFLVLLMGANVTATGSGEGCGRSWPLCNGSVLPAQTLESFIEYSHRIVTSIEGIFVAATSIVAWPLRKRFPQFKALVPAVAGTLILQSLMGAAAVMWPQTPEVMASHFGISLVCLAAAALIARIVTEARDNDEHLEVRRITAPTGYRLLMGVTFIFSIVVAYSGAYVRHTGAELACTSWPTCNGELIPEFGGLAGNQTLHRLAALGISLMIVTLLVWSYRFRAEREDLHRNALLAFILVIAQSIAGAIVVFSGLQLLAALTHAALMALLFVVLSDGLRLVLPPPERQIDVETVQCGSVPRMATGD
ncbi:MAG TPA: COX15/CtaA family protein [Thermomicrobiales bacterium]|nr:COX15/CtaA family protein [Thermomicrobiales bacterium]